MTALTTIPAYKLPRTSFSDLAWELADAGEHRFAALRMLGCGDLADELAAAEEAWAAMEAGKTYPTVNGDEWATMLGRYPEDWREVGDRLRRAQRRLADVRAAIKALAPIEDTMP